MEFISRLESAAYRQLLIIVFNLVPIAGFAQPGVEPLDPFYRNEGIIGIVRALRRVECGVRVLHIGAHPDDEDNALLTYLSLGRGARVTYLSLTRGEGGQNSIGPETGEMLGVLRTAELLAARKIDGAGQLFGRMIDFGFSKSPEECFQKWGEDEVVKDIVRAIRYTRPHIIISRFQGNAKDGHGQHQAAGIAAREAFSAAADPNRFPELLNDGLEPWQAQKFYVGSFGDSPEVTTRIDTGAYDPWLGRSYAAIGYHARSQHRSQDMGMIEYEEPRGPSSYICEIPRLTPGTIEKDMFDGLDLTKSKASAEVGKLLLFPEALNAPAKLAPALGEIIARVRGSAGADEASIHDLETALGISIGLRLDALSESPGLHIDNLGIRIDESADTSDDSDESTRRINCYSYVADPTSLTRVKWEVRGVKGITVKEELSPNRRSAQSPDATFAVGVTIDGSPDALVDLQQITVNSCQTIRALNHETFIQDGHYTLGRTRTAFPFNPPPVEATFRCLYQELPLVFTVPVEYRTADPQSGEIRENFAILPTVSIEFEPRFGVTTEEQFTPSSLPRINVKNLTQHPVNGSFSIFPLCVEFRHNIIPRPSEHSSSGDSFRLRPLENKSFDTYKAFAGFSMRCSQYELSTFSSDELVHVSYPHIRGRYFSRIAEGTLRVLKVETPKDIGIGYIQGLGDDILPIVRQLGMKAELIDGAKLRETDLSNYEIVVLGPRAYEAHPELVANNEHLLDYVRDGGTLIVQYNKYEPFEKDKVAPYPMKMNRPHDRVTDEEAAVTILQPDHPVFNYPNKITDKDFEGWVQERGLYFWSEWDERYTPLLACADPGEAPQKGGLLIAPVGKGNYVYAAYAFFRQLPAGVEGATRLFINLISLGHPPQE